MALLVLPLVGNQNAFAGASGPQVDIELQLLVDVSGSVSVSNLEATPTNPSEFELQRDGWADAFISQAIKNEVNALNNGMCVQLIYWSAAANQQIAVDWFHVFDDTSLQALHDAITAAPRPFEGGTAPGSAINVGYPLFNSDTSCDGTTQVMDVSGDGVENIGDDTSDARDAAIASGVDTINGLVIGGSAGVLAFYVNNIQAGTNAFTLAIADFSGVQAAAEEKIMTEIMKVLPVGGEIMPLDKTALLVAGAQANYSIITILALLGVGAFGALFYSRKK